MAARRVGATGDTITGNRVGRGESLRENDAILPAQFYALRTSKGLDPERRLMVAVLEDAVLTYQRTLGYADPAARAMHDEARFWLFSRDRSWPFSFENICDAVGLDAGYVRRGLRELGGRVLERTRSRVDLRAGASDLTEGNMMRDPANPYQPRWVR